MTDKTFPQLFQDVRLQAHQTLYDRAADFAARDAAVQAVMQAITISHVRAETYAARLAALIGKEPQDVKAVVEDGAPISALALALYADVKASTFFIPASDPPAPWPHGVVALRALDAAAHSLMEALDSIRHQAAPIEAEIAAAQP